MKEIKIIFTVTICICLIIVTCVLCNKYNPSSPETPAQQKVEMYRNCIDTNGANDVSDTGCAIILNSNFQ